MRREYPSTPDEAFEQALEGAPVYKKGGESARLNQPGENRLQEEGSASFRSAEPHGCKPA